MTKKLYSFRFNADQYASFKQLALAKSLTVTEAFERFISICIASDELIFPDPKLLDHKAEARVLINWLKKGKYLYRKENGEENNVQGRLFWLLIKVPDAALKREIEAVLKKSVVKQK